MISGRYNIDLNIAIYIVQWEYYFCSRINIVKPIDDQPIANTNID